MAGGVTMTFLLVALLPAPDPVRAEGAPAAAVRIGLASSLFHDAPDSLVKVLARPMLSLMETQTGLTGQLMPSAAADDLAKQLQDNRTHLAVFHGFEFAWARIKYPELKPLIVVVSQQPVLSALLVVKAKCEATCPADLKGQVLALPRVSREHCRLFLERTCCDGKPPRSFFGKITTPSDAEDALDDVIDEQAQAAIVESLALENYRKKKAPKRAAQLKVLVKSEAFPAGVIAYHEGGLPAETLRSFRDGMIKAHESARGKELLNMCRINCFAAVPDDYDQQLTNIAKVYPPPKK
jgi:ABC-type phosphate/phosphonate transport system substrate-binding protein